MPSAKQPEQLDKRAVRTFQAALLAWWDADHADLPWRQSKEAYRIWVSEIMLQQTQIATVIPYYERWMARFPDVQTLAAAPIGDVLKLWEGLGYYRRAHHLHQTAQTVVEQWNGELPQTAEQLLQLKGIGPYTAGAIASIAFDQPTAILDGNIIRVLSRWLDLDADVTQTATKQYLWQVAGQLVPQTRAGDFNQALMELGQTVCATALPRCESCPLQADCLAQQRGTQLERPVRPVRKRTPHYDVVAGVIYREDGKMLIAQRPLEGLLGGLWEFPGGKVEAGESHEAALVREIMEELGVRIRPNYQIVAVKHAFTHFRITLHAYHATLLAGVVQHLAVRDHAWVTLEELAGYAFGKADRKVIDALRVGVAQPRLDIDGLDS